MPQAREHFLAATGFRVEDYSAPTYNVKLWKLPLELLNTKLISALAGYSGFPRNSDRIVGSALEC